MTPEEAYAAIEKFFVENPAGQACQRLRDEERYQREHPYHILTEQEVQRRADVIRVSWADRELAAYHEHRLWEAVLMEIALGAREARELAIAALYTREVD